MVTMTAGLPSCCQVLTSLLENQTAEQPCVQHSRIAKTPKVGSRFRFSQSVNSALETSNRKINLENEDKREIPANRFGLYLLYLKLSKYN